MTDFVCDGIRFTPMLNFNDVFQRKTSTWNHSESNDLISCARGVGERAAKERDSEEASGPSGEQPRLLQTKAAFLSALEICNQPEFQRALTCSRTPPFEAQNNREPSKNAGKSLHIRNKVNPPEPICCLPRTRWWRWYRLYHEMKSLIGISPLQNRWRTSEVWYRSLPSCFTLF